MKSIKWKQRKQYKESKNKELVLGENQQDRQILIQTNQKTERDSRNYQIQK